jgi:hypothetical protein
MKRHIPLTAVALTALVIAGCGGGTSGSSTSSGKTPAAGASAPGSKNVLPIAKDPIKNTSTTPGLTITKALVENNTSPATGKVVDDHLEVVLKNTSAKPLDNLELYYKITDPAKGASEGYYAKLSGFSIQPGASRVAHFDNSGTTDHYPVNKYSLYYTDKNALVVDITASSPNVKPATFTVKKDSGGAEAGVE